MRWRPCEIGYTVQIAETSGADGTCHIEHVDSWIAECPEANGRLAALMHEVAPRRGGRR